MAALGELAPLPDVGVALRRPAPGQTRRLTAERRKPDSHSPICFNEARTGLLVSGEVVERLRVGRGDRRVYVDPDDVPGVLLADAGGDARSPIAAPRAVTLVTEPVMSSVQAVAIRRTVHPGRSGLSLKP
jgi:hypothetical protein